MPASLPEKLQELQWAVDHWDLTEGPIAEASDKQVKYILSMMKQAVTKLPTDEYDQILMKYGLSLADTASYHHMQDELLDLNWKKASGLITDLKTALGPGAGMVGDATFPQLKYLMKLVPKKDQASVEALFTGLGYGVPDTLNVLSGYKLSKVEASKAIDALSSMAAASAVAPSPKKSSILQRTSIEDLILDRGMKNPAVLKIAKKYKINVYAGNIGVPPELSYDDALTVIDALAKVKQQPKTVSGSPAPAGTSGVASDALRKQVFDLYLKKGGVNNDKVMKILSTKGELHSPLDLPLMTTFNANAAVKQLKKLKVRKATRQQVGMALALLSQLGPAQWKHSPMSKKWPQKDLRAASLMKRNSVDMKVFIFDLKKLIKSH